MIEKIAVFCKNILDWFKSDRCFINPFIKAFPLTNNLLLITLALCFATFNALYFGISLVYRVNIFIITLVLAMLSSAFVAGFCQIVKDTVQKKYEDNDFERFDIKTTFASFYTGIGKKYLSYFGGFILFFIILIFSMMASFLVAVKFICPLSSIGLDIDTLQLVLANQNAMAEFASQMTKSQIIHLLGLFYITNILTPGVVGYLLILWVPEFTYTEKNVFISLFTSIKKLFSDFWNTLCIYMIIAMVHFLIALTFASLPQTSIMLYLSSLAFVYWVVFNIFTVFIYYRNRWLIGEAPDTTEISTEQEE